MEFTKESLLEVDKKIQKNLKQVFDKGETPTEVLVSQEFYMAYFEMFYKEILSFAEYSKDITFPINIGFNVSENLKDLDFEIIYKEN